MPSRRNWDDAARVLWPELTRAAKARDLPFYSQLSPLISTIPLNVGRALGPIQTYCIENRLPPLTSIVVGKVTGKPGDGFVAWDIDDVASALERVFRFDWSNIHNPFSGFSAGVTEATLAARLLDSPERAGEVYSLVRDRGVAQRVFRRALLVAYDYRCCFCGLSFEEALEAAHIVEWQDCEPNERVDVRNGLLLCATHHKLFDSAYISITEADKMMFSDPEEKEGVYSMADKDISVRLHGQKMLAPSSFAHKPRPDYIERRRAAQGT